MKSQAILQEKLWRLVFEQVPDKKVRIMLYIGKFYVTSFSVTVDQLRDVLICMDSKQMKWIDQSRLDKEFMHKYGYVLTPLRSAYTEEP